MTADLGKTFEMVDRSDAYVGIFAWRCGFIPPAPAPATPTASRRYRLSPVRRTETSIRTMNTIDRVSDAYRCRRFSSTS